MRWELDFENRLSADPAMHTFFFTGSPAEALFFAQGYMSAGYALLCIRRMD